MISVHEATGQIDLLGLKPRTESVCLADAGGRILAKSIVADRDGPPFDRVAMDGIAIAYESYENGRHSWKCKGLQAAGNPRQELPSRDSCLEAMTGATLPEGADTIIPFEHIEKKEEAYHLIVEEVKAGQNIHTKGSDYQEGQTILFHPCQVRSPEIAVAASVGLTKLDVTKSPKIALVTTGSELVDVEATPLPHQIRKSNIHASREVLMRRGYSDLSLHHLVDDEEGTRSGLRELLSENEVLILSGGVSKGKLDYVPSALEACGVEKRFHRIAQKPGKPMWVGEGEGTVVFACPGNPVSMLVCLERYVLPFLDRTLGKKIHQLKLNSKEDVKARPSMTLFKTVRLLDSEVGTVVEEVRGNGSGDFSHLCEGDGFIEVPPAEQPWPPGTAFTFWPWS